MADTKEAAERLQDKIRREGGSREYAAKKAREASERYDRKKQEENGN